MLCPHQNSACIAPIVAFGVSVTALSAFRAVRSSKKRSKQRLIPTTPREDGFFMPAEWDRHDRCWLLWPYRADNWRQNALPAQRAYAGIAKAIAQFEPVTVGVPSAQYLAAVELLDHDNITIVEISSDDAWIRDTGPTFVVKDNWLIGREVRAIDWRFNAYGGLYQPWDQDELIARKCIDVVGCSRYKGPIVLEGGAIHTDGQGTCLTTEECLLHPSRNPGYTKDQLEEILKQYLGVKKVIWLKKGLYCDEDTNGHIDNICCFVRPAHVLLAWSDVESDPQYGVSRAAYEILANATDAYGRRLKIDKLPVPAEMLRTIADMEGIEEGEGRQEGERLAGSYVNFYIANGGIVVPGFGDPNDALVVEVLQRCFPDRRVVQVQSREVLLGGGNIHCITQQMPAGAMT